MATNWGTGPYATRNGASLKPLDFRWCRSLDGSHPSVIEFPEAASQSFTAGKTVVLQTSGDIRVSTTGENALLGVALKDATGITAKKCPVLVFGQDDIFDAVANADVTQANIGDEVDLALSGSTHLVDIGASTDKLFRVFGLKDGATDSTNPNYRHIYVQACKSQVAQNVGTGFDAL